MYVVGFNGPPESGKDTLARFLLEHVEGQGCITPIREESLSLPLRSIGYAMVDWRGELDGENYKAFKDTWFADLERDGRHLMIDASESFLKPVYGLEIMANMLLTRLIGFNGLVLVRDNGFQVELAPLIRAFGRQNVAVVQCHRPGKDFANDSREWVTHPDPLMNLRVDNDSDLEHLRTEAGRLYGRLVNARGWKL